MKTNKLPRLFWAALGCAATGCAAHDADAMGDEIAETSAALSSAPVDLIAIGTLSGQTGDLSRETSGPLENGVAGNLLGGIGSGLTYAGGKTFLAVPDRGPNATPYNDASDDTVSYIPRFQTLRMQLKKSADGASLPFSLTPELRRTTLLSSPQALVYGDGSDVGLPDGTPALNARHRYYFSGRSDNFDAAEPSSDAADGRLDPESIRVSNDGQSVFISDEYGPYVYEFDRHSGKRTRVFTLPSEFAVSLLSPQGDLEISENNMGRLANKGMEGLAITPDGRNLVGIMQSPLLQDGGKDGSVVRMVRITIANGALEQFAYQLTNIGTTAKPKYPTISDLVAINDHEFLVDERDGKGLGDDSAAAYKKIYRIDLRGAQDVSGLSGEANLVGKAVAKSLFLDVVAVLNAHGIASTEIPSKLEGLAFGPDVRSGHTNLRTLFLSNDNDFLGTLTDTSHPGGVDNPNTFFVFGIDATQLASFAAQPVADDEADDTGD